MKPSHIAWFGVTGVAAVLVVTICVGAGAPSPSSGDKASQAALDADTSPIQSCGISTVQSAMTGIDAMPDEDAERLCSYLQSTNGGKTPVNELRALAKDVVTIQFGDAHLDKISAVTLGKAMIDAEEARGEAGNPGRQTKTFDVLFRMASGSGGDVTPLDVNVFLRNAGTAAQTISDEGLINLTGAIDDQKKDR